MKRIITGLFLLIIGGFVLYFGGLPLYLWLLAISLLLSYEMINLFKNKNYSPLPYLIYPMVLVLGLSYYYPQTRPLWDSLGYKILILAFLLSLILEFLSKTLYISKNSVFLSLRIVLISSVFLPFIYFIRESENGLFLTSLALITIWFTDIFAYYGGKFLGKTKLSPLSPKKTIEGSIIGTIGAVFSAFILCHFFSESLIDYLILIIALSVFSQIGDLHQSLTKRFLNAKDSSQLLPGHGGFYDRADSTLFVFPIFYYMLHFLS